jgi:hypothetical protein
VRLAKAKLGPVLSSGELADHCAAKTLTWYARSIASTGKRQRSACLTSPRVLLTIVRTAAGGYAEATTVADANRTLETAKRIGHHVVADQSTLDDKIATLVPAREGTRSVAVWAARRTSSQTGRPRRPGQTLLRDRS